MPKRASFRKIANAERVPTAKRMKADGHTAKDVAKYLGASRATLHRYLSEEAA
ncbi:MAG TPA: helix-turn-helix domain-containing protein [Mycobacterium sp.]